nr:methyltransferase domain-containing protein [Ardenticatena sp.]
MPGQQPASRLNNEAQSLERDRATALTRARYDRLARIYDLMEGVAERRYHRWRDELWQQVEGPDVLEIGVGTGKNMPYYPPQVRVHAIDLSPAMLERARRRAAALQVPVDLRLADAQHLPFDANMFDDVVATFVFCSVPDPVLGLREALRVAKPGGRLHLLEHVRAETPLLGTLMDGLNPLVVRLVGANINRRTVENVRKAGWDIRSVHDLDRLGIFKHIVATKRS